MKPANKRNARTVLRQPPTAPYIVDFAYLEPRWVVALDVGQSAERRGEDIASCVSGIARPLPIPKRS